MGFLLRAIVNALAIVAAGAVVPGVQVSGALAAIGAGLVLGLVNALLRPVLILLTLPLTLVTLGLFLFVLNALCLWLTAGLVRGLEIEGFWAAFLGALLVSLVNGVVTAVAGTRGEIVVVTRRPGGPEPR